MRVTTKLSCVLLFAAFLLVGCATSSESVVVSYDASSNQTVYKTQKMRLDDLQLTEGLQKENRYYVQVTGACSGQDCVPQKYTLSFMKEGRKAVRIKGRDVRLTVGTETMSWDDPQGRGVERTTTVRSGTFAKVDVTGKQLTTIGSVRSVSGVVGGASFSISRDSRAPIRRLLSKLGETGEDSAESRSSGVQ